MRPFAMTTPDEILEQLQSDLAPRAEDAEDRTGIDRREFMFASLVAAAATTFGGRAANAQRGRDASSATVGAPQEPAVLLGNGTPPAEQFMPYPGGTGALMEKMVKEHGPAAFQRVTFAVPGWTGPVPTSEEDIAFLPAHRLSALIRERKLTSTRLTTIYLERLERLNPTLLCAVTIMEAQALTEAARADAEIEAGKYRGPLHGLPYGVKDLFSTRGVPTTWGAADFENRIIDEDAEVVVRLRDAGAVLIAKLATGLFARNDQWFRGRTNNPWNVSQGSSGSSAGPASATAAGCVAFAIGTETAGSIVSPSIRCGVSALRPTFGRVSRYGGMVLAWSHDRVGPLTRTPEDAAMVFNVIHGVDEKDPSTVTTPFRFNPSLQLASVRVGVDPNAPAEMIAKLRELGLRPREIGPRPTVPGTTEDHSAEGAAAFDEYVRRKAKEIGLDLNAVPEVGNTAPASTNPMAAADWNPRFVSGRAIRAFEFIQAERRRYILISKWAEFMKDLDMFIASPNADVSANAQTGHPCAVVPYKFGAPGPGLNAQPICGTIVGALYADDKILGVAHQLQIHTDFGGRRPMVARSS